MFIKTDANGTPVRIISTTNPEAKVPAGYVVVDGPEAQQRIRANPGRNLVHPDGTVEERRKVKIVVSNLRLNADGADEAFVEVKGLLHGDEVDILIGNQRHTMTLGKVVRFTTTRRGKFPVRIADPRFYNSSPWGKVPVLEAV